MKEIEICRSTLHARHFREIFRRHIFQKSRFSKAMPSVQWNNAIKFLGKLKIDLFLCGSDSMRGRSFRERLHILWKEERLQTRSSDIRNEFKLSSYRLLFNVWLNFNSTMLNLGLSSDLTLLNLGFQIQLWSLKNWARSFPQSLVFTPKSRRTINQLAQSLRAVANSCGLAFH